MLGSTQYELLHYSHAASGLFRLILKNFEGRRLPSQEKVAVVGQPAHALKRRFCYYQMSSYAKCAALSKSDLKKNDFR